MITTLWPSSETMPCPPLALPAGRTITATVRRDNDRPGTGAVAIASGNRWY